MTEIRNIKDLELLLNENKIFDKLGIDSIGVFGSFARGEKANDIDLLLENVKDKKQIIEIKESLEDKTDRKIDIVFDDFANPIILHRAKKELVHVKKYQE